MAGGNMSANLIQSVYLFKTLTEPEMDAIGRLGHTQTLTSGDTVFYRGEPAKALYFIKYGTIKIQQSMKSGDNLDVATLSAGSHFGEMAFVDGEPRSATAVAGERGELFVIPYEKLEMHLKANPNVAVKIYRQLALFLCGRLRATTADLSSEREKNLSHF